MTHLYMIVLAGQGDIFVSLVDQATFVGVTGGDHNSAHANDRALEVESRAEHTFTNVFDAIKYIQDNDVSIRDVYEGMIY